MHLYRLGPDGRYAARTSSGNLHELLSDPFEGETWNWRLGPVVDERVVRLLPPVVPGKIVGIGRNYRQHAEELGNPVPEEPVVFLKSPSSLIGPAEPILLPPESQLVHFEGEIALVIGKRLSRAAPAEARRAILGVTCACDVTARDLQRRDKTFARAKSFDTFCPLGPAITVGPDLDSLELTTHLNGELRQQGHVRQMLWGLVELTAYIARMMTLMPGDVILTGTPAGVGPLAAGDRLRVEVSGVGALENPVKAFRPA